MQYPDYNAEQRLRVGTDEAWEEYRARAGRDPNLAVHEKAPDGRTLCGIAPDHVKFAGNLGKWAWVELGPGLVNCLSCKRAVSPQRLEEWRKATIDEQRASHGERERLTKMVQWLIRAKAALAVKEQAGEDTTELVEAIIRVEAAREALRWHLL